MRAWVVLLLIPACFYDAESPLPAEFATCTAPDDALAGVVQPTWYRDVEPLVAAKCAGCHTDSGIAPFALTTYQDFVPVRSDIHRVVADRIMPPWQPSDCCNHYRWDRSLSAAERNTLLRWLEQGMALGD